MNKIHTRCSRDKPGVTELSERWATEYLHRMMRKFYCKNDLNASKLQVVKRIYTEGRREQSRVALRVLGYEVFPQNYESILF